MKFTRTMSLSSLALVGVLAAVGSASAGSSAKTDLVIRHQLHGCHSWSLNGAAVRANQTVSIHRGAMIRVTNDDVMSHKLVETSGPAVVYSKLAYGAPMGPKKVYAAAMMARIGASTGITFSKAGTYKFTTKVGEDYMAGVKTVGEDNVLHLTVHVS